MRIFLNMDAKAVLLFACLIQISISLGNSLDFESQHEGDKDEEIQAERDLIPEAFDEFDMSFLKCTSKGCELVKESVNELPKLGRWELYDTESQNFHSRSKRRMFLPDNRLRLRENSVGRFPFKSSVAIRVGGEVKCSGVALKHRHFLTAAHCVQPGDLKKDVEVGVLSKYRVMQWAKVNDTRMPPIWKSKRKDTKKTRRWKVLKDYAVLETETTLPVTPMPIGYVGTDEFGNEILQVNKTYMYFSAFDDERRPDDLNMRFCQMKKIKHTRIFSRCDTVSKTAGAGVYLRMRNKNTGSVERKVIAIATGDYGIKAGQDYSVALRINSRMFAHICYFLTDFYDGCD